MTHYLVSFQGWVEVVASSPEEARALVKEKLGDGSHDVGFAEPLGVETGEERKAS